MNNYSVEIDGQIVAYTIRDEVTFEDVMEAYQRIVNAAFHTSEDEYEVAITVYTPYLVGLARDYATIALYTDLDLANEDNEYIWRVAKTTDVIDNIMADEHRRDIVVEIYQWADRYIEDYKTRVLANASRDELFAALKEMTSPSDEAFDGKSMRAIAGKIDNMSEEDMLKAIIKAAKSED